MHSPRPNKASALPEMSLLRMDQHSQHNDVSPNNTVSWLGRKRITKTAEGQDVEYLFTSTLDSALSFLAPTEYFMDLVESGYMDPESIFPPNVIKSVNYAIKRGASAYVISYALPITCATRPDHGDYVGVVLELSWGTNLLGIYAMRLSPHAFSPSPSSTEAIVDTNTVDTEVCDD